MFCLITKKILDGKNVHLLIVKKENIPNALTRGFCQKFKISKLFLFEEIFLFYFIILPHTINYKQNKSDNK